MGWINRAVSLFIYSKNMNPSDLIKEKFKVWNSPLGPVDETEDIIQDMFDDMSQFADYLGNEHAEEFVKTIRWMIENDYPHLTSAYMFVDIYGQSYGKAIAAPLMNCITPKGPVLLVELLGSTKDERAIDFIMKTIDLATAEEELLIACIGAIGEIGGNHALMILQDIPNRCGNKLTKQVMEELKIAIHNNQLRINPQ